MDDLDHRIASEFMYRLLRHHSWIDRKTMGDIQASVSNRICEQRLGTSFLEDLLLNDKGNYPHVQELKSDGYTCLGDILSKKQVEEMNRYFSEKKGYPSHVASEAVTENAKKNYAPEHKKNGALWCSYSEEDSLKAPHMLEMITSEKIIEIVSKYLGAVPTLYNLNTWWTFSNEYKKSPVAQMFHRDPDGFRFVTLFTYLTNTEKNNNSHEVVKTTHNYESMQLIADKLKKRKELNEEIIEDFLNLSLFRDGNSEELDEIITGFCAEYITELFGGPGTAFLEDTWALHRAVPYARNDRLVVWARFGLPLNAGIRHNGISKKVIHGSIFPSELKKIILRKYIFEEEKLHIIVFNDSSESHAKEFRSKFSGNSILYRLAPVYNPERLDYKGLINLLNSIAGDFSCFLFIYDEFNPTRDYIVANCGALNSENIGFPEKMPIVVSLHGISFEYTRRIFPYPGSPIDTDKAKDALTAISRIFIKSGLYWHISFGTLLGLIRDETIIPWDVDLDLVALETEIPEFYKLFPEIIDNGFEIARINSNMITFWRDGIAIDLYKLAYREQGKGGAYFVGNKEYFHEMPATKQRSFDGVLCTVVPEDAHAILDNLYGPSWRTPDPQWEWGGDLFE